MTNYLAAVAEQGLICQFGAAAAAGYSAETAVEHKKAVDIPDKWRKVVDVAAAAAVVDTEAFAETSAGEKAVVAEHTYWCEAWHSLCFALTLTGHVAVRETCRQKQINWKQEAVGSVPRKVAVAASSIARAAKMPTVGATANGSANDLQGSASSQHLDNPRRLP